MAAENSNFANVLRKKLCALKMNIHKVFYSDDFCMF